MGFTIGEGEGMRPESREDLAKFRVEEFPKSFDELRDDIEKSIRPALDPFSSSKEFKGLTEPPGNRRTVTNLFSNTLPSLKDLPSIRETVRKATVGAVTRFLAETPSEPTGKAAPYDGTRVTVTLDPRTGEIKSLQPGAPSDSRNLFDEQGNVSLPVAIQYDKKSKTYRLTLDRSTKTGLSDARFSPEFRLALAGLHGQMIEVPTSSPKTAQSSFDTSPLAGGALSLGGLLAMSPEILKVEAVAIAAVLLGRFLFSFSDPAKPSLFRRILHFFSNDMAVRDWADKAWELNYAGKIQSAKTAYEKAIELASKEPQAGKSVYESFKRLEEMQHKYGDYLIHIGEFDRGVAALKASYQYSLNAATHAPTAKEKDYQMLMFLRFRVRVYELYSYKASEVRMRGDHLIAASYYEKATDFAPGWFEDARSVRINVLARAWQQYERHYSTPEGGAALKDAVVRIIKKGNSFGISGLTLRNRVEELDIEDRQKK